MVGSQRFPSGDRSWSRASWRSFARRGSYGRAADAFEQHDGEGVRDYVFLREWDALSGEHPGRLLLAALSDLNTPISFGDLQTILQNDQSKVLDAIGGVREMFLTIDQAGEETLFSLAPLTRKFVAGKKGQARRLQRAARTRPGI